MCDLGEFSPGLTFIICKTRIIVTLNRLDVASQRQRGRGRREGERGTGRGLRGRCNFSGQATRQDKLRDARAEKRQRRVITLAGGAGKEDDGTGGLRRKEQQTPKA